MTCFDCKVCFGSKFTSSAEGRRFNWLIYDSMTSLFACGRFSKSRGLSASVSFLPSFPFPFPLFYSLHSSPCNSLLPNCTETLATQAMAIKKQLHNVVSFLNKNHLYNDSLFLVSHCCGSVEPIYIKKELFRLRCVLH